jgi:hypothetical protein
VDVDSPGIQLNCRAAKHLLGLSLSRENEARTNLRSARAKQGVVLKRTETKKSRALVLVENREASVW